MRDQPASLPAAMRAVPRVRVRDAQSLAFDLRTLAVDRSFHGELRAVARRAAPRQEPTVIDVRLGRYEWAVTARASGNLRAFMLGQTREIDGQLYFYFGPLYSTHGAFLPLFARTLHAVCRARSPWWLVAEIEHCRLRPLFAHLVPSSWPKAGACTPPAVVNAVRGLASALGHIQALDPETMETTCCGVRAQLVVARAEGSTAARRIALDLESGLESIRS